MNRRNFLDKFGIGVVGVMLGAKLIAQSPKKLQGPVAYYKGSLELNPPSLTCSIHGEKPCEAGCDGSWAVVRGFPRKRF